MSDYWENRAAWDMYHAMEDAEKTAKRIARIYRKALTQLTYAARDVFDKYRKDYGLSETEAWELLNKMQDKTSIDELLLALRNEKARKGRQDILKVLEAPAYASRIERFKDLMQQVDFLMQNVYEQEKQFDTAFFENLARNSYYKTLYNTQRQTGYGFGFSNISEKEIADALSINWSGKHYSKRIWKNTQDLAETLKEEMVISLLTGRTDRETAQTFEKTFNTGTIQARRLVRTESAFVHGELQKTAYKEAGIKKYRYVAILDLRTSELCRGLDGKTFSVSEAVAGKNYPPMHPWCRSTTINIVDDEILGNMKRNAYDPETGRTIRVPANMTYKEWYKQYVEGKPKAEAQEKAAKNAAKDRRQFDTYQKVLGKDMPKHFADFQEMKYNEPKKYENLKLAYQDAKLQEQIRSESYPKSIEEGKQGKHILGHNNYIEGRSYLTIDVKELQGLVNKYAGTGELQRDRQGHWNHKEAVTLGKKIGVYKDLKGNKLSTDIATIHYSKKGVHVVPAKPKEG